MSKYFGTDGVRGVANSDITPELVYKLGKCGAYALTKQKNDSAVIVVAKDTRISGDMLESSLVAGICSVGAKAICIGIAPTPCVPYLIKKYNADAGIVISASHNPFKDNGIKFFNKDGFKLSDELEQEIENLIDSKDEIPKPSSENIGYRLDRQEDINSYIDFLATTIDTDLKGIKVCIDCANGATYKAAPRLFKKLGASLTYINTEPNGININKNCGSTHMEELANFVKQNPKTIGIAFDGDGDRCLAVDEAGNIINGDVIMAICSKFLKEEGRLKNNSFVATIMSNLGLFIMGEKNSINISKSKVGDRYVIEKMLENGSIFGGEQSGHIIFLEHNTTGDGLLTAIQLLSIIKKTGKSLTELKNVINILPQVLINAKVCNSKKNDYLNYHEIKNAIKDLENKLKENGRVIVRPSGTEPIIRVMLEGENTEELQKYAENLVKLLEKDLNL